MGPRLATAATLGFGLWLGACTTGPAGPSSATLTAEHAACMAAGDQRDGAAAIKHCSNALEPPDLPSQQRAEALGIRGMGYAIKGDCDRAIVDFDAALNLDSDLAQPLAGRGWCFAKKKDFDRALPDFNRAIAVAPDYADAYVSRGWVYLQRQESDQAMADFSQAIMLQPDLAEAHDGKGIALLQKGDYEPALTAMNAAIRLDPDEQDYYNDRGLAQLLRGQWRSAVSDLSKAIALNPDLRGAYENRSAAFFVGGEYRQALADIEHSRQLDAENPYPYIWIYMMHWRLGEIPDAALQAAKTDRRWPGVVLRAYRGEATEQEVLAEVNQAPTESKQRFRDCEASLYLAARDRQAGRRDAARLKLEHARDVCPLDQLEQALAVAELRRL